MTRGRVVRLLVVAALAAGCINPAHFEKVEYSAKGPSAQDLYLTRMYEANGRTPTFDERRRWEAEMEDRVYAYLRAHPELEQSARYMEFRFWWQVGRGNTPEEVRVLLDEPQEQTADPARMAALAEKQWSQVQGKAKEAWVYQPGWVIYFDETSVMGMVRRVSSFEVSN